MGKKLLKILADSTPVIIGIIVTGILLDEVGTNGRLGKSLQVIANKITRGYGQ